MAHACPTARSSDLQAVLAAEIPGSVSAHELSWGRSCPKLCKASLLAQNPPGMPPDTIVDLHRVCLFRATTATMPSGNTEIERGERGDRVSVYSITVLP